VRISETCSLVGTFDFGQNAVSHEPIVENEMISRDQIQCFAATIAREFQPERIILFRSHARGRAGPDSDVDLLVIMPRDGKSPHQQVAEIYLKCRSPFPVDILVRTREEFEQRQQMRDWFMREIAREGIILYAARNGWVDRDCRG
jgi:uncharacterized protein